VTGEVERHRFVAQLVCRVIFEPSSSRGVDNQLRDEAMTLYLAGHETTALTLSWSWYLISQHPQVEDKLVADWRRVLGGRTPTPDDLPNLPYTDAVLTEAMRVYPPVYLIGREATRNLELGRLPREARHYGFMSQWASHRDPRYFHRSGEVSFPSAG